MPSRETPPTSPLEYISYRLRSYAVQHDVDPTPTIADFENHPYKTMFVLPEQGEDSDRLFATSVPHVLGRIALWEAGERHHLTVYDDGVRWLDVTGTQFNSPEMETILNVFGTGNRTPDPVIMKTYKGAGGNQTVVVGYEVPLLEGAGYTMEVTSFKTLGAKEPVRANIADGSIGNVHVNLKFPATAGRERARGKDAA